MLRILPASIIATSLTVCVAGAVVTRDDDAAVRAVLRAYLSSFTCPNPTPLDPQLFAEDIEAFWSDGTTYRGRDAFVAACESEAAELEADSEKFAAELKDVVLRRSGDSAWIACRIERRRILPASIIATSLTVCVAGAVVTRDDDAAVRAVLRAYLSSFTCPNPTPLDPQLFAEDIEAFWDLI